MASNLIFTSESQTLPVPSHVATSNSTRSVGKLPLVLHNDGSPCWPVCDWLIWLAIKGTKSSTLKQYGYAMSLFVRFLDARGIYLDDLSDSLFYTFSKHLLFAEKRSRNAAIYTMRRVLGFLMWAQDNSRTHKSLIGTSRSFQLRVEVRTFSYKSSNRGVSRKHYYHHDAIPKPEPRPNPPTATSQELDALWEAAAEFPSAFRRHRAFLILDLLEMTGIRRSELVGITLSDIETAAETGSLPIRSAKRTDGNVRNVPLHHDSLDRATRFIEQFRNKAIANGCRTVDSFQHHNYLLVTYRGFPYSARSVTSELKSLREKAKLSRKIHPHSLRRRFNSKLLIAASQSTDISKGLPDGYKLIHKAIMGWKSDEMLEVYFDHNLDVIEKGANFQSLLENLLSDQVFRRKILDLRRALQKNSTSISGISNAEATEIIDKILVTNRKP